MRDRLLAALVTPQVLVALLLALGGLALLLGAPRTEAPAPVVIDLETPEPELRDQDTIFVVVDEVGQERVVSERLALPDGAGARLAIVIARLRELSMQQGVWPVQLPAPGVYVVQGPRGPAAVIDLHVPEPVGVSVVQETALARTLLGTAQRNGVVEVRFLRDGRPTNTLLGHVAVASEL